MQTHKAHKTASKNAVYDHCLMAADSSYEYRNKRRYETRTCTTLVKAMNINRMV